jgi:glucose/arabinose dehydrogenase
MSGIVRYSFTIVATLCVAALSGDRAFGQVLKGEAAYGGWHDDRPELRRLLTPQDLPPIERLTYGLAQVVPIPTGARPQVPDGFSVERVTSALRKRRVIREAPNGDLFVADTMFDAVHVLRIPPGGAHAVRDEVFASGLKQPFGIAFYPLGPNPRWVYIANSDGVVRFRYKTGDLKATGKPEQIIAGIPTTHHYARDIAFSADGHRLFFSVGSGSNAAQDMFPEPHLIMHPSPHIINGLAEWSKTEPLGAAWDTEELRADVLSFDPDGTHMQIVATGLRNCEGITVQPGPVGLAVAKDGSLIVTEDGNGTLWRVAYRGDARTASGGGEIARHIGN